MARPINQIQQFRNKVNQVLSALEDAQGAAQTIDYLGGITFYRDELNKTDEALTPIHNITPAQFTAAINALASIKTLLEADNQAIGKALARMRD